jgi:hypothetical protein
VTAAAPTWGEIEAFVRIDGWTKLPGRGRHLFYEKLLPDGRTLQTHVSHSRDKRPSPGRFSEILRYQLEVSKTAFWEALASGRPVERPVPVEEPTGVEHEAWVVAVLVGQLHMSPDEIAKLTVDDAKQLVYEHWSRPRD